MKKMKILKWTGIAICLLFVAFFVVASLSGGIIVRSAVNKFGPMILGVPVTLEKASFSLIAGKIKLTNLHVGNPNGFRTPMLIDIKELNIELKSRSLFTDTVVIHKIVVVGPHITYEKSLFGSNISSLMKQLEDTTKPTEKKPAPEPVKGRKKVIIEQLIVTDPELDVSITAAGGHYIPVKLGRLDLKDIGKEHGGVTFADAIGIIFSVITSNIENAVLGAGELIESGVKAIGPGVVAVGGAVVDGASAVIKGVGGLFGSDKKADEKKPDEKKPEEKKPEEKK